MTRENQQTDGEQASMNYAIEGAEAELRKDEIRSFALLTTKETGEIVYTWNNGGPGDLESMLGHGVASLAHISDCSLQEAAVAVLKRAREMEPRSHEPVNSPAPSREASD